MEYKSFPKNYHGEITSAPRILRRGTFSRYPPIFKTARPPFVSPMASIIYLLGINNSKLKFPPIDCMVGREFITPDVIKVIKGIHQITKIIFSTRKA